MCPKAKGGAQTLVKFEFRRETPKEEEIDFEVLGRTLLTWLKEVWTMKSRVGLDMVEVYNQIRKWFHIGDYRDMFLW